MELGDKGISNLYMLCITVRLSASDWAKVYAGASAQSNHIQTMCRNYRKKFHLYVFYSVRSSRLFGCL